MKKERSEVEGLVKVLCQELHLEQLDLERSVARVEERADDGLEHLLPERRLRLFPPGHQLRVEPEPGVVALLAVERAGADQAQARHRDRGEQPAHRVEQDGELVPVVLLRRRCVAHRGPTPA